MKNTNGSRFVHDDQWQWWYIPSGDNRRGRAYVGTCKQCNEDFLSRSEQPFCSTECRGISRRGPSVERFCLHCKKQIQSPHAKCYCSHACACSARHKRAPVTTPLVAGDSGTLFKSDNPRYSVDDRGQWWYTPSGPKKHSRTRAYIKDCAQCGGRFLVSIFHRKTTDCCSQSCRQRKWTREHPEHYKGPKSSNWKGGRRTLPNGYIEVWNPKAAERARPGTKKPYILEHRLVMEQVLGRPLAVGENVHHKNGIRDDNRPENLELWKKQQPPGQRATEQRTEIEVLKARIAELTALLGSKPSV